LSNRRETQDKEIFYTQPFFILFIYLKWRSHLLVHFYCQRERERDNYSESKEMLQHLQTSKQKEKKATMM
jgi:hypothetical protein